MKILIFSENEYGCGASIVAWMLTEEYARLGHEVVYIFQNPHPNAPNNAGLKKIQLRVQDAQWQQQLMFCFSLCLSLFFAVLAKLSFVPKLTAFFIHLRRHFKYQKNLILCEPLFEKIIEETQPDAINLHHVQTNLSYAFINKTGLKHRILWTFHGCFDVKGHTTSFKNLDGKSVQSYPDLTFKEMDLTAKEHLFKNNNNVQYITPSAWLHRLILPDFGFPKNVHVINNGLSPTIYEKRNQQEVRQRLGLDPSKKYALAILGKLHLEHKNFKILYQAFEKINDPNIQLIVIGNRGKWTTPFPENILFLGPIFDDTIKCDYFCAADLFVIPSLADNFPTVILESMFCGTPILGANIGGIPEMVIEEKTGWLFNPYQAKELSEKIEKVIYNQPTLSRMSNYCLTLSESKLTLTHQTKQYLDLMQKK